MDSKEPSRENAVLRLSGVVEESIVDGPGLRFTVFVQGCPHHCPGCHNPQTHPFTGGCEEEVEHLVSRYRENPLLAGITFSGGEPFCQPGPLAILGEKIHALGGNVITYTGYYYEELLSLAGENPEIAALLAVTDTLIDGPYVEAERDMELPFRGSRNQRILTLHDPASPHGIAIGTNDLPGNHSGDTPRHGRGRL